METDSQQSTPGQTPESQARFWQVQLHLAERGVKDWHEEADGIIGRYRAEKQAIAKLKSPRQVNVLYSNTETLRSAIYAKTAKPDVRQRFTSENPVARAGAEVLERALTFTADPMCHHRAIKALVLDALLPGAGVVWVEYEPKIVKQPMIDPMTGAPAVGPDGQPMMQDIVADQKVEDEYIYWRDFLWSPARDWEDVWWIARRHRMTREDMKENGFEDHETVALNWEPDLGAGRNVPVPDDVKRAEVWEIWHKPKRERVWIVKGHTKALRTEPDPYGLEGFWPTPGLLSFVESNETLVPVPEFRAYAGLADDLDETQSRISHLTKALKRRGVRDSAFKELARLAKAADNEFVAIENYQTFASKGGLEGAFQTEDIEPLVNVLLGLYQAQDRLEAKIDKLTGVADVMRGNVDPKEKLGQTEIKAQFGGLRIKDRQKSLQGYLRELMRIKAELMAEHFEPHVLQAMTGMEIQPEVMQMLRDDKLRCYAVDVETDSTIFEDSEAEKQARVEITGAVTSLMEKGLMMMQAAPEMGELIFESIGLLMKTMKGGRQLEETVDRVRQQMTQRMQMQAQQPQTDPKLEAEKVKSETMQMKAKADMQKTEMDMIASEREFEQRMQEMAFTDVLDERKSKRQPQREGSMLQ